MTAPSPQPHPPAPPPLRAAELFGVTLLFLALVAGALAAAGFTPATHYLGGGFRDIDWELVDWNVHYWNMWEFRRIYLGLSSPVHTTYQFFPEGLATLTVHGDLLMKLVGGALALVFSPDWTYLLMNLLVLVGNGLGGYILARGLGLHPLAALLCGGALCFSGAAAWSVNTGNLENGCWLWICLYLTGLLRLLRGTAPRRRTALLTALLGVLAILSNFAFFYAIVLLSALLLLFHLRPLSRRRLLPLALMVACAAALLTPVALTFLRQGEQHNLVRAPAPDESLADVARENSATLDDYRPWALFPRKEDAALLLSVWLLLLAGLIRAPRAILPWAAAALLFVLLSLGPRLLLHHPDEPGLFPLPFDLLHRTLPLFSHIRFPHRLVVFAVIPLAVAAAVGAHNLLRAGSPRRRAALLGPALLLVLGEGIARWPLRVTPQVPPSPLYARLARLPGDGALITFPLDFGVFDARYLYFQTIHGRPLFNGCIPRYFHEDSIPGFALLRSNILLLLAYTLQQPYIHEQVPTLPAGNPGDPHTVTPRELRRAAAELVALGFRFVLLHQNLRWEQDLSLSLGPDNLVERLLTRALGPPRYRDAQVLLYPLRADDPARFTPPAPSPPNRSRHDRPQRP